MAKVVFSETIRAFVMERAGHSCEYCKSQDKFSPVYFTIDHIRPITEGGSHDPENLAYACMLCNRLKWKKVFAHDPVTNAKIQLFHPRNDPWLDHFQWSEDYLFIIGTSPVGRATVIALQLNREKLISYRKEMLEIGRHPAAFP